MAKKTKLTQPTEPAIAVEPVLAPVFGAWISVDDKLPEMNEFTLIHYGGRVPLIGCYKGEKRWLGADSDFWEAGEHIRWWMPLPPHPSVG